MEFSNATDLAPLEKVRAIIDEYGDFEADQGLQHVETRLVYVNPQLAEMLLQFNKEPKIGEAGTNRRIVANNITELMGAIERGEWKFTHQGIGFNVLGDMIDGQHRLKSIVRAGKTNPDISLPMLITTGLPVDSDEKIDLVRRRSVATFLAKEGHASSGNLNTILRLLVHYGTCDFEEVGFNGPHWGRIITLDEARATLEEFPIAADAVNIGSQLRKYIAASAAGAGWVLCRTKYPEAMNMEFVSGIKTGANLGEDDPRLAFIRWATNQKDTGMKVHPAFHLAAYIKAFTAFRLGEPMKLLSYRSTAERFPRA